MGINHTGVNGKRKKKKEKGARHQEGTGKKTDAFSCRGLENETRPMGRIPRTSLLYDDCYAHVISRSIAKQNIFETEADFLFFEGLLRGAALEFKFSVFHYCLMHTHFHLIVSMEKVGGFSEGMRQVKWGYTQKYNRSRQRRGPLWQNRFKTLLIENDAYLYACGLYVEQNPVRAGLIERAEDWPYSSRRHYLGMAKSLLVTQYDCSGVLDVGDFNDGMDFERGFAVGSDWFKYKLKKGYENYTCLPVPKKEKVPGTFKKICKNVPI